MSPTLEYLHIPCLETKLQEQVLGKMQKGLEENSWINFLRQMHSCTALSLSLAETL